MTPQISIIIPVYNAEKYIARLLDSIYASTFQDFEIICIDDGSTDNSAKIITNYIKTHKNLRLVSQPNHGIAYTRNRGIKLSHGEFLMFMDNDDYISKTYLETYYRAIHKTKFDFVIGGYQRIDSTGRILHAEKLNPSAPFSKFILVSPWAKIYRRDFVIKNHLQFLDYPIGEDVYFTLNALFSSDHVKIITDTGYTWFYNDTSVSNTVHTSISKSTDLIFLFDQIAALPNYHKTPYLEYYFYRFSTWYLLYAGRHSAPQTFTKEFSRLHSWLRTHDIEYHSPLFSRIPAGDHFKNRLAISVIFTLGKLHLLPLFAKIYCQGAK